MFCGTIFSMVGAAVFFIASAGLTRSQDMNQVAREGRDIAQLHANFPLTVGSEIRDVTTQNLLVTSQGDAILLWGLEITETVSVRQFIVGRTVNCAVLMEFQTKYLADCKVLNSIQTHSTRYFDVFSLFQEMGWAKAIYSPEIFPPNALGGPGSIERNGVEYICRASGTPARREIVE